MQTSLVSKFSNTLLLQANAARPSLIPRPSMIPRPKGSSFEPETLAKVDIKPKGKKEKARSLCTAYAKSSQDMLQRCIEKLDGWTESTSKKAGHDLYWIAAAKEDFEKVSSFPWFGDVGRSPKPNPMLGGERSERPATRESLPNDDGILPQGEIC